MKKLREIEQWQIKKMWSISKAIGMTSDDLHAMAGADSLKRLDFSAASDIISRLTTLQGKSYAPKTERKDTPKGATAEQQGKVWALMYELEKYDATPSQSTVGERLCGIIRKELHTDCLPKNPFIWLGDYDMFRLIEKLKKYIESANRQKMQV